MEFLPVSVRGALPAHIWDYILDDFAEIRHTYQTLFNQVLLELRATHCKNKLELFSGNGLVFKFDTKPSTLVFNKTNWLITFNGLRFSVCGDKMISLSFETVFDGNTAVNTTITGRLHNICQYGNSEMLIAQKNINELREFLYSYIAVTFCTGGLRAIED